MSEVDILVHAVKQLMSLPSHSSRIRLQQEGLYKLTHHLIINSFMQQLNQTLGSSCMYNV